METKSPGLNEYVKDTKNRTGPKTKTPKKTVGLNEYVKSITPEVSKDGTNAKGRGIFLCQKGHKFHATFAKVKQDGSKSCPQCNNFVFKLDELIKTKHLMFGVSHHLKMPDMSSPLRFLVETQNRRNAAAELARDIELLTLPQLDGAGEHVLLTDNNDSKYMAMLDLVGKVLKAAADLYNEGNFQAAQTIKDELVGVLNGN